MKAWQEYREGGTAVRSFQQQQQPAGQPQTQPQGTQPQQQPQQQQQQQPQQQQQQPQQQQKEQPLTQEQQRVLNELKNDPAVQAGGQKLKDVALYHITSGARHQRQTARQQSRPMDVISIAYIAPRALFVDCVCLQAPSC